MRYFTTELRAINVENGELCTFRGQLIEAISFQDAKDYCNENGLGYLKITGELVEYVELDGTRTNQNLTYN